MYATRNPVEADHARMPERVVGASLRELFIECAPRGEIDASVDRGPGSNTVFAGCGLVHQAAESVSMVFSVRYSLFALLCHFCVKATHMDRLHAATAYSKEKRH